jgi:hypothetical protein
MKCSIEIYANQVVNITQKCGDQNVGGLGQVERFLRSMVQQQRFHLCRSKIREIK